MGTGEKMVNTYRKAYDASCLDGGEDHDAVAMRAVLETHVKPLLAEAFERGGNSGANGLDVGADDYAARTIAALTKVSP